MHVLSLLALPAAMPLWSAVAPAVEGGGEAVPGVGDGDSGAGAVTGRAAPAPALAFRARRAARREGVGSVLCRRVTLPVLDKVAMPPGCPSAHSSASGLVREAVIGQVALKGEGC